MAVLAAIPVTAHPQQAGADGETVTTSEDIVVVGEIRYRDRSEETAPTLVYGLEYF